MTTDNKTLADVQPGGRVRLGDQALSTSEGARRYVADFFAKQLRRHDFGNYILTELAADFACALAQHLSAQPSPGGQGDALRSFACEAVEYFRNRSDVVDGDYGSPSPNEEMKLLSEGEAALAARQPEVK
ncbi:hypothetical protein [Stenotrophomonas maltophilia]|uniref:hypothetical protein n=1 Tax=Stenotrophomonas maltophilia TaxID=40324 RepID=UPI00076CB4A2|nr:hypothetical protein [Stenotrophomonas maltophilia]KWV46090.1 hypothetical protein AS591_17185 [Stenotrophomonas maltophilia]MBA0459963.1 hypothetical protein [Stenotrophomonas maltophilia]